MIDHDEIAGRLIDDLRDRDDIAHVSRSDNENRKIEVIVEPEDLDDETTFIPSEVLERLANAGFGATYAKFNHHGEYSEDARVMGFERL